MTGVLECERFAESLAQRIVPGIRKVAVITDDSPTSDDALAYMRTLKMPVQIVAVDQPSTFAEWQASVRKHQEDADAILFWVFHTVKNDKDAEYSLPPGEVIGWTLSRPG